MRTSNVGLYALRLTFGQMPSHSTGNSAYATATRPDRIVTRSATMLAVFGIALSSFSLKQMLAKNANKRDTLAMRKF